MDLVFCTEARFIRRSEDLVYSIEGSVTNVLWKRYLNKFEHIYIMARVLSDEKREVNEKHIASGERVSFIDLPYYIGPWEYLKVKRKLKKVIEKSLRPECVYICRVPGVIGGLVATCLHKHKLTYGVEVVGDPWDVFAPGVVQHPLRAYFRYKGYKALKRVVVNAAAALYVTEAQLQTRYPVSDKAFQISASNVQINTDNLPVDAKILQKKSVYNLLSIGSLEQMYKAPDVVLQALAVLKDHGIECRLTWLGEGKYKEQMLRLAEELHIDREVSFMGNVSRNEVDKALLETDIFLLVSRTEGLPRALIEAMAMGLPCIGTRVGGILELLEEDVLIPKNDVMALVNKLEYMTEHIDFVNDQAQRNFERAAGFSDRVLQEKRESFYEYLISIKE